MASEKRTAPEDDHWHAGHTITVTTGLPNEEVRVYCDDCQHDIPPTEMLLNSVRQA